MDQISGLNLSDNTGVTFASELANTEEQELLTRKRKSKKGTIKNIDITGTLSETLSYLRLNNTESFRCLTQLISSNSSILLHDLYEFPPLLDPGLEESLNYTKLDVEYYSTHKQGRATYISMCKDFKIPVIKRVVKYLVTTRLDLRYFGLSLKQIVAITAALKLNHCVTELILGENTLTSAKMFLINEILCENNDIEYLNLSCCNIDAACCTEIAEGISHTQSLKELDISRNYMGNVALAELLPSIRENLSIVRLDISHNFLDENVAQILGRALSENECITHLNLSWNNFNTRKAMNLICKGLSTADMVQILNLSWNCIKDNNIFFPMQEYLFKTKKLQHLDLSNNCMRGSVFKMVQRSIVGNSSLISINMSSNFISPDEVFDLAQVFVMKRKKPLQLEYLDMEDIVVNRNFGPYWKMVTSMGKHIRVERVLGDFEIVGPNVIKVLFDRLRFLTNKKKSQTSRKEFGHFLHKLGVNTISKSSFLSAIRTSRLPKLKTQENLLAEIIKIYAQNYDKLNIQKMKEDYYKLYPDTTIPKTDKAKKLKKAQLKTESGGTVNSSAGSL